MAKTIVKIVTGKHVVATGIFLALIAGLLLTPGAANAMGGKAALKSPDQIVADLKTRLNLTDEQTEQVRPIIEEHVQKRNAILQSRRAAGGNGGIASLKEDMRKLREDTKTKLQSVLSRSQMDEFRKYMEEQAQAVRERRRGAGAALRSQSNS